MNEKTITQSAKTKDEAIALALTQLGLSEDEVEIEVVEEATRGFLGLGSKDAVVKVTEKISIEKKAVKFLDSMVSKIVSDVHYETELTESKALKIVMSGDDMGILIGRRGETLDSLQYLTSLAVNKVSGEFIKVQLDTENYRERRHETLVRLARRLASQVARSRKSVTLEPMSPNERRIIHSTLQTKHIVKTESIGEEPNRKVVISLK